MILVFTLSMPSSGAWDGKWSGEGLLYAKTVNLGLSKRALANGSKIIEGQPYLYDFGDGWVARINVRKEDAKEARRQRKFSRGFCGYDWMVDSIRWHGRIQVPGGDENDDQP